MSDFIDILPAIACGCVLPIMIVWFFVRQRMNDTNQRTQIVLAAIEKNPEMDLEELMEKISPKKKLLKEKLLAKLPLFIDMVLIENIVDAFECSAREGEELDYEDIENPAECLIQGIPYAGIGKA